MGLAGSFGLILGGEVLHLLDILFAVVLVEVQGFLLCGTLNVGLIVDQFLDAQQDLFHCYVGLPVFFIVEDGEADCSGGVDVGVWEDWFEDAFGGSDWVIMGEIHEQDVCASLPRTIFGSWDLAAPFQ